MQIPATMFDTGRVSGVLLPVFLVTHWSASTPLFPAQSVIPWGFPYLSLPIQLPLVE